VLLVLAEELGQLIDAVGYVIYYSEFHAHISDNYEPKHSGANHAHVLLQPLEALAAVEESVVREKVTNN
jgi:hypothetical protein